MPLPPRERPRLTAAGLGRPGRWRTQRGAGHAPVVAGAVRVIELVFFIEVGGAPAAWLVFGDPVVLIAGRPAGSKPQGHEDHDEDDDHDEAEDDDVSHCTTQCLV